MLEKAPHEHDYSHYELPLPMTRPPSAVPVRLHPKTYREKEMRIHSFALPTRYRYATLLLNAAKNNHCRRARHVLL